MIQCATSPSSKVTGSTSTPTEGAGMTALTYPTELSDLCFGSKPLFHLTTAHTLAYNIDMASFFIFLGDIFFGSANLLYIIRVL